jgi:hypothetical protein
LTRAGLTRAGLTRAGMSRPGVSRPDVSRPRMSGRGMSRTGLGDPGRSGARRRGVRRRGTRPSGSCRCRACRCRRCRSGAGRSGAGGSGGRPGLRYLRSELSGLTVRRRRGFDGRSRPGRLRACALPRCPETGRWGYGAGRGRPCTRTGVRPVPSTGGRAGRHRGCRHLSRCPVARSRVARSRVARVAVVQVWLSPRSDHTRRWGQSGPAPRPRRTASNLVPRSGLSSAGTASERATRGGRRRSLRLGGFGRPGCWRGLLGRVSTLQPIAFGPSADAVCLRFLDARGMAGDTDAHREG